MTHYDLALIGTGSGNTIVDKRFSDRRVAILEEGVFGGTCINVGCIPTKMFVYPADLVRDAYDGPPLGVRTSYDGADWPAIRDRVFGRIDPISVSGREYREEKLENVDYYPTHTTFADDHTLVTASGERLTADQIVIAAGSRVVVAPIPGLEEAGYETSNTVMRLDALPRRIAIVGGGFVAAEFAHVFSSLGSEVVQVHRGERLLQKEDEDVAAAYTKAAQRQRDVRLSTTVERVTARGSVKVLALSDGTEVETDVILMATGRKSNADRLGLENTGIALDDDIVKVDDHQRTSVEGVWALGDVSNHWQLKHVANHEARTIQHNLLHPDDLVASDHRAVPSAVFTHPQIAKVGLTEQEARDRGLDYRTGTQDYADVAYGWAMESPRGETFVKVVADAAGEYLLGAHIIGAQASNLVQPLIQAMSLRSRIHDVARGQYWIHPALAEVVENALLKVVAE